MNMLDIKEIIKLDEHERGVYFAQINRILLKNNKKQCSKCGIIKFISYFSKGGKWKRKQRYHRYCTSCRKIYEAERKLEIRKDIKKMMPWLLRNLQNRTNRKLLPQCNLTKDYLWELWQQQNGLCFYTDTKINTTDPKSLDYISIDKIDNKLGYVRGNICFTTQQYNWVKSSLNFEQLYEYCKKIILKFTNGKLPNYIQNINPKKYDWPKQQNKIWVIQNPKAKINTKQAIEIKKLIKEGNYTLTKIGKMYGLCIGSISAIKRGLSWKHI